MMKSLKVSKVLGSLKKKNSSGTSGREREKMKKKKKTGRILSRNVRHWLAMANIITPLLYKQDPTASVPPPPPLPLILEMAPKLLPLAMLYVFTVCFYRLALSSLESESHKYLSNTI